MEESEFWNPFFYEDTAPSLKLYPPGRRLFIEIIVKADNFFSEKVRKISFVFYSS